MILQNINNLMEYGTTNLIFIAILFIIKQFIIYSQHKNEDPLHYQVLYFLSDIPIIILFLFLIRLNKIIPINYNIIINIFLIISCFHFYIDIISIKYFRYRANIPDIFSFCSKESFSQYYKIIILLFTVFIALLVISIFITKILNSIYTPSQTFIFIGFIISYLLYISFNHILKLRGWNIKFYGNIYTLNNIICKSNGKPFYNYKKWNNNKKYSEYIINQKGDNEKLNVILLFDESLSAIDSKLLGGYNNMPLFDKISKSGITFKNFISNGTCSISAHVSTLLGLYPYQYESYEGFNSILPALPDFFNKKGYKTEFISTVSLNFLNQRKRLNKIGFKKIIGEESFKDEQHFTRDAAPDHILYKKTLDEIKKQKGNFFIGMQNISFHENFQGYNTPYGKTEKEAIKYSDEMLYNFYLGLKKINYFNSGILIIIGDHRKPRIIVQGEDKMLGTNRYTRSAATIIGKGIEPGSTNNNIVQHTDFFHSIKKFIGENNIGIDKTYNNVLNGEQNRKRGITMNTNKILGKDYFTISYSNGESYSFNEITKENIHNNEIYDHLTSQLLSQFKQHNINCIYQ